MKILYIFFFLLLFLSCDSEIDIEIKDAEEIIVLSSFLNEKETFAVQMTKSLSIADEPVKEYISQAVVEISAHGMMLETLVYDEEMKMFVGVKRPLKGIVYSLKASAENLTSVSSSSSIPEPIIISDLLYENKQGEYSLSFIINDKPEIKNFYRLSVVEEYLDSSDNTISYKYPLITSSDPVYRSKGEDDASSYISSDTENLFSIFSDEMINGKKYRMYVAFSHSENTIAPLRVKIVLHTITEDYFLFLKTYAASKTASFIPFSQPVKIYSNILNGAGIFAASSSTYIEL
jgi:hypothetical protein